jgi:hypothetical protein
MHSLPHRDPAVVDEAVQALRAFGGDNLTAHQATKLLEFWAGRDRLAGSQWREVIRRFPGAPIIETSHRPGW